MTRLTRTVTLASTVVVALALAVPVGAKSPDPVPPPSETASATIGADASGYTGAGVGVAVVDTGVSPMPTLGDQVAVQFDVSGPGRLTDGHGHGTFLAGLVAGQEGPSGHRLGVAPDAHIVSVKVADAAGRTSLDRLLAGFAAIRSAPAELNIRVVVLALGGPADDVPDPIEEALEQLWADGYVVVVASGNTGGELTEPGTSPYLLTVGAIDDAGTADHADDTVPAWSGSGTGRDGQPKPDVLAPGQSLVSTRIPGATADRENPDSRIAGKWFRGSGTSQAAAVVGGAAAVLLEADPTLTPDEVKGRLVDAARPVDGSAAGAIDVPAALTSDAVANGHLPPVQVAAPTEPNEDTWSHRAVTSPIWVGKMWNGKMWNADTWVGKMWNGKMWNADTWVGKMWNGKMWNADIWVQDAWAASSWSHSDWVGKMWNGKMWNDGAWFGKMWNQEGWVVDTWQGRSWN